MEGWLSEHGRVVMDFVIISTLFLLVMVNYLDRKVYEKHRWIHHSFLGALVLQWGIAMAFKPLQTKMFATLMVFSVVIVETAIKRQRKNSVGGEPELRKGSC
ncbi:MAG: hypothetical protein QOE33_855 [Acidobacteriota bacterium]|nr:hypothetical protein [Acidobacteriota bacterium]